MENLIFSNDIKQAISNLSNLVFEVTDLCNLKCKYCGYGEFYENHDPRKKNVFPVKSAIALLDYMTELWKSKSNTSYSQEIYIGFYGGEPLLNIEFIHKIVAYTEKIQIPGKKFTFSMTTNAMLLNRYMDFLVDKGFILLISLDGNAYNHSYRVTHSGENSFEKVFSNIRLLQEKYPDYFDSNVNFNAVLHNRNSVSEICQFVQDEFGKIPGIGELNTTGISKDKQHRFWETYRNKYESLHQAENVEAIREELFIESPETADLGIFLHQYSGNVFRSYNDLLTDERHKHILPTGTCIPFSKKMFVTVNGKILPCERIGHQYALGEVTEHGVFLDFEKIADRYNNWYKKISTQCSRCYNTKACTQCIFNLDDPDGKPVCNNFMDKRSFHRYVSSQLAYLSKNPHLYKRIMEEVLIK
jgi:uncharacterized protein